MESRIVRWGNSLAIRIPRSVAAETGLEYGASVDVRAEDGAMVVRPLTVAKLDSLLRKVKKSSLHGEVSTGRPKGREAW
jgi:antitoxin MazE